MRGDIMTPEQIDIGMATAIMIGYGIAIASTRKWVDIYIAALNIAWMAFAYYLGYPAIAAACAIGVGVKLYVAYREHVQS